MARQKQNRREFLGVAGCAAASAVSVSLMAGCRTATRAVRREAKPPNVVLVLTDDQGYGDLGCHGNQVIETPNLDRLYNESVRFNQFYVAPVCSPTRASLMTGRYNYRTGAVDTYLGRSMMYADELTLPELLAEHGYRTGIFGKWHLGDNYPLRAMDQGFQESLVHNGGGIGQPSDPPGNSYFDPVLKHNGREKRFQGYCTDVFTRAAVEFIKQDRERPFFVYLSTNAPHDPLDIAEDYVAPYRRKGVDEDTAKVYGMITNIDENVGRLLESLGALGLENNTIVVFLTDNGPAFRGGRPRYNAGLRAGKGTVYEGGIRVPFFLRWPGRFEPGKEINRIAAHIDVLPTLLDLCGVPRPTGVDLDGISLVPLVRGEVSDWPDRRLFFQWHRGDVPELYRNCAARSQRYKLVNGEELYDMVLDPAEQHDIAGDHPEVVESMRADYAAWFEDVGGTRGYAPPRIHLGTPHENPTILTRQDWRGAEGWGDKDSGYWEVHVAQPGTYNVRMEFRANEGTVEVHFRCGGLEMVKYLSAGAVTATFSGIELAAGDARLEAWIISSADPVGPRYVIVERT